MYKFLRIIAVGLALLCLTGCAVRTGWITEGDKTIYADENGEPVSGWLELDGSVYYFGEDHSPVTGWNTIGGEKYVFDTEGRLITGWLKQDGSTYYLGEDGICVTGWMSGDLGSYYFGEDGVMATGWTEIDGQRYYFSADGVLATGRLELENGIYLLDDNGLPLTGWQSVEGKRCYCAADGAMAMGWTEIDGARYYFDSNGAMVTGKLELEEGTYLLGDDGTVHTGWFIDGDKRYYYREDGAMAIGRLEIEGQTYYFNPHGEAVLLVNPWNYVPSGYTVELETVEHYLVSAQCSKALAQMLADCRAAGFSPAICSAYRTQSDQKYLYSNKVKRVMAQGYSEADARVLAAREVAIPGTSEHQLGLAVDIVDDEYWVLDEKQAEMPTQKWLMEHCWEYGFILRYPVGSTDITGIIYEPWHYRYVGVEMALEIRDLGITLEEYLGAADHG